MSEFKAIETQEALDEIIKARLERNTKTVTAEVTKQFEGYISPDEAEKLKSQLTEKDTSIAELTAKNSAYEAAAVKARIAREYGIPAELADRISGANEEEYKADAENLAKFVKSGKSAPMFNNDDSGQLSGVEKAFYQKNPNLRKG